MNCVLEVTGLLVPIRFSTVTFTLPTPGGATAVIASCARMFTFVASFEPNQTVFTTDTSKVHRGILKKMNPLNAAPTIVTSVPPAAGPVLGSTLLMVGS